MADIQTPSIEVQGYRLKINDNGDGTFTLVVSSTGGGGGGTQYTAGTTQVTPIGTVALGKNPSNVVNPLALDGSGNLLVNVAASGTLTVSQAAIPADSSPATQNITTQDLVSSTATGFDNQSIITGAPTAGSAASFSLGNFDTVRVQVTGTWTGTLQSELSMDGGTTWYINAVHLNGTSFTAASFTGNFQGEASASAVTNYRLRATAAITGTAVVTINKTNTPAMVNIVTPIRLQDSTTQSIGGTIKAASTAAVATDTALVVAISPNGTISVITGSLAESTAAWTSVTAGNTALQVNTAGYSTVIVTFNQGTTITGGVVTFEASDTTAFTNAYQIQGQRIAAGPGTSNPNTNPNQSTYNLQQSTNEAWIFSVASFAAFRVRLSTVISGTGTVNVGITANAVPTMAGIPMTVTSSNGGSFSVQSASTPQTIADNLTATSIFTGSDGSNRPLYVADSVYGGAFSGAADAVRQGWSKMRAPTVFKTVQATASGNTVVWTPGTGNKFRILRLFVQVTDNASLSSGAVLTIDFRDATVTTGITIDIFVPTTPVTTTVGNGLNQVIDLGPFGILSSAINNALNVNLSAALATGNVRVVAMGTEE